MMKTQLSFIEIFAIFIIGIVVFSSCSTSKELACPDFKSNRNYKKKYQAHYKTRRIKHKTEKLKVQGKEKELEFFRAGINKDIKKRAGQDRTLIEKSPLSYDLEMIKPVEFNFPDDFKYGPIASNDHVVNFYGGSPREIENKTEVIIGKRTAVKNNFVESGLTRKDAKKIQKEIKKEIKQEVRTDANAMSGSGKPALGFAIASLVLGILGLTAIPFIGSLLAVIFGSIALVRLRRDPGMEGRGMAIAGLVMGVIGLAIWAIGLVAGVISALFWWV